MPKISIKKRADLIQEGSSAYNYYINTPLSELSSRDDKLLKQELEKRAMMALSESEEDEEEEDEEESSEDSKLSTATKVGIGAGTTVAIGGALGYAFRDHFNEWISNLKTYWNPNPINKLKDSDGNLLTPSDINRKINSGELTPEEMRRLASDSNLSDKNNPFNDFLYQNSKQTMQTMVDKYDHIPLDRYTNSNNDLISPTNFIGMFNNNGITPEQAKELLSNIEQDEKLSSQLNSIPYRDIKDRLEKLSAEVPSITERGWNNITSSVSGAYNVSSSSLVNTFNNISHWVNEKINTYIRSEPYSIESSDNVKPLSFEEWKSKQAPGYIESMNDEEVNEMYNAYKENVTSGNTSTIPETTMASNVTTGIIIGAIIIIGIYAIWKIYKWFVKDDGDEKSETEATSEAKYISNQVEMDLLDERYVPVTDFGNPFSSRFNPMYNNVALAIIHESDNEAEDVIKQSEGTKGFMVKIAVRFSDNLLNNDPKFINHMNKNVPEIITDIQNWKDATNKNPQAVSESLVRRAYNKYGR